jgi:hypothetical protein
MKFLVIAVIGIFLVCSMLRQAEVDELEEHSSNDVVSG